MKNKNKLISGILLLSIIILTIIPAISSAESSKPVIKNGPKGEAFGTSTRMMNASSTIVKKQNNLNVMGVIGTVSSSSSFTVNNVGRNNATTTYTVNVDANTIYRYGTTTSSFSAITTGKQVMVSGSLSTSTNIVTAKFVNIIDPNLRNRDIKNRPSLSTNPNSNGMFHKMINWFKSKFR